MKFNPQLFSVVFELNRDTVEEDLAVIGSFYSGELIQLTGCFNGVTSRAYQVPMCSLLDRSNLAKALEDCGQESVMSVYNGQASIVNLESHISARYSKLESSTEVSLNCTYCPETKTYWRIA